MNSFKERAARARAAYEKAAQPTAYEKAIQNSFPLGAGMRRRGTGKAHQCVPRQGHAA